MADTKVSALTALTTTDPSDVLPIVDDPGGTPISKKITVANLVGASTATLTNKTFDADGTGNSITNIENADIKAGAAIAVNKLAALTASRAMVTDGSGFSSAATTTAAEIGYVNGVTSAIQTQLDTKITSSATTLDSLTSAASLPWTGMATGVDGEIPTFDASGNPAFVAVGTSGHVLTSNGAGAAPTFQAPTGGSATFWNDDSLTTAYASATTFTISGSDETDVFLPGRGLRFTQSGVNSGNPYYGCVASSTFSTNTTVTVFAEFDIGNEALTIELTNERIGCIQYADNLSLVTDTSNAIGRFYTKEGGTALGCRAYVQTAPTGADAIFDLHIGGTSDYTTATNCTISATGTDSGFMRGDLTVFLGGVEMEFFCDQKGSTVAGAAPNIQFFYIPSAWKFLT